MENVEWGLLGPEAVAGQRRTRTLGLGVAVRSFNDLAVPGMGGAWFGKQLFLATLGVAVAEEARNSGKRVQNIEVANAVEALACWRALNDNGWKSDPRLRGARKMRSKADLSFTAARKRSFYVTQPMRQATIQPLRALGLVESSGERFNTFRCTESGEKLIDVVCDGYNPMNKSVLNYLVDWVKGSQNGNTSSSALTMALSPLEPMSPSARDIVRERLAHGQEAKRRETALKWVEHLREKPSQHVAWQSKPHFLEESHWRDLHSGALFFAVRDTAIELLDEIEAHLGSGSERLSLHEALPNVLVEKIGELRDRAAAFLERSHDPTPAKIASHFCKECTDPNSARLIEMLVQRCEGRGLRQNATGDIVPGIAFRGRQTGGETARSPEEDGAESEVQQTIPLPNHISRRVRNLFLLNLDLRDELNDWLSMPKDSIGEE